MEATEEIITESLPIKNEPIDEIVAEKDTLTEPSTIANVETEPVVVKQESTDTSAHTNTVVNPEIKSEKNAENEDIPTNILDDIVPQLDEVINSLSREEEQSTSGANEQTENAVPAATEEEDESLAYTELTPNFFDDIIPPEEEPVPLEALPEEELERKYSAKLREYISLENIAPPKGTAQKRAQATTTDVAAKRTRSDTEERPQIRLRSTAELTAEPNTSTLRGPIYLKTESTDDNSTIECLQVMHNNKKSNQTDSQKEKEPVDLSRIKIENVFNEFECLERNVDIPAELKREYAIKRATAAQHLFKNVNFAQKSLLHTDTVRKLPTNTKYLTQQYYDNRSQLHTNNVPFSYSTPSRNIKLSDWGLEPLTPTIAKITKVLGYDVHVLNFKIMHTRKPLYLPSTQTDGELVIENGSTIYSNVMTQTNISGPVTKQKPIIKKLNVYTQTNFPTPSYALSSCVEKFPSLKRMDKLNPNQLLALNDFAELMQQDDIAADLFRLRECLLQIYNRSRMPAIQGMPMYTPPAETRMVPPPPPAISNPNTTQYMNMQNYSVLQQQQEFLAQQQQQEFLAQQQQQFRTQQQNWQNQRASKQDPRLRNNSNNRFNR